MTKDCCCSSSIIGSFSKYFKIFVLESADQ